MTSRISKPVLDAVYAAKWSGFGAAAASLPAMIAGADPDSPLPVIVLFLLAWAVFFVSFHVLDTFDDDCNGTPDSPFNVLVVAAPLATVFYTAPQVLHHTIGASIFFALLMLYVGIYYLCASSQRRESDELNAGWQEREARQKAALAAYECNRYTPQEEPPEPD